MSAAAIATAQRMLNGQWLHASAALEACRAGAWREFVASTAPPRPLLLGRFDYARCFELALQPPRGPETIDLTLVPLWACAAAESPASDWVAVHGLSVPGEALAVVETGPFIEARDAEPLVERLWLCSVRRWRATVVAQSRAYAPGLPLLLRAGEFCALELSFAEVVAVDEKVTAPRARPTREVPIFASMFEPRVEVSAALAAQISALNLVSSEALES